MKFVLGIFEIKMDTMIFMRLFLHPTKKNYFKVKYFKGSPDPNHFLFEINVGKGRIRHRTAQNRNDVKCNRFGADLKFVIQCRCMSDPTLSDIDFKNKIVWI